MEFLRDTSSGLHQERDTALNFTATAEPVQMRARHSLAFQTIKSNVVRKTLGGNRTKPDFTLQGTALVDNQRCNAGLGLTLEILTQRHCATNLLGVGSSRWARLLTKWNVCSQLHGMVLARTRGRW